MNQPFGGDEPSGSDVSPVAVARRQLSDLMIVDEFRLRRRLDRARKQSPAQRRTAALERWLRDVEQANQRIEQRRASVPRIEYPENLPITARRDDILAAIEQHQVVVLAGETGSGKTTQLPKFCLELGRGVRGMIGHTQPRRLAARTVAERIAEELQTQIGSTVGYQVRFNDRSSDTTMVKLMTDGILLAEIQADRMLRRYETIILDEAHERSLNIDFLLGYLKQLLPRRPDLKLIVTSATIETGRFAAHFDGAPVLEVSGRTYPVELRYRPIVDDEGMPDNDEVAAICTAVRELQAEPDGDVLVFLSGEREIRDTADALVGTVRPGTEIVQLYARLSAAEQHRVFEAHDRRRVVLATNVAETSLTVPGIRYVIDPGNARISRYSNRLKVQRLPIEPISRASANQRAGRCGRVAEGICIRLYAPEDFEQRPEFTDPEILRTNLASVILRMLALDLGDIADFPFVDPPDRRQIRDGIELLTELGALEADSGSGPRLTSLGRRLAQLPLDPRLGRMILAAEQNSCVREVLVITAGLSIQDPRELPNESKAAAEAAHRRFADPHSDFLTYLSLWNYLREQQRERSSSSFRRMCRSEYLHYLRVREWQDLHGQVRSIVRDLGIPINDQPADPTAIHQSLLAGLLSHIGMKTTDKFDYQGARGAKFAISPGSVLFKSGPRWVMAGELVETTRLWARTAARIQPEWVEPLAEHLVRRSYSEPHWEPKRAAAVAFEKVLLYGLPIVARRKVDLARLDPVAARELFIRHALVAGEWSTHHRFLVHNRDQLAQAGELEERVRRRGLVLDDESLYEFYADKLPADVVNGRTFDFWWKRQRQAQPDYLDLHPDDIVRADSAANAGEQFPESWEYGELTFPLSYRFEPGADEDGVTVRIPLELLNQLDPAQFTWQVPGLREELVTELIRALPKAIRRSFVPAPNWAGTALRRLGTSRHGDLLTQLAAALRELGSTPVAPTDFDLDRLPAHLRMRFAVIDDAGAELATSRDLAVLRSRMAGQIRSAIARKVHAVERDGLTAWTFGDLPREVSAGDVTGYPALVDRGTSVAVQVLATPAAQRRAMWAGTRRLLLLNVPAPTKAATGALTTRTKLLLAASPAGSVDATLADATVCAVDALLTVAGGPVWTQPEFGRLRDTVAAALPQRLRTVTADIEQILNIRSVVASALERTWATAAEESLQDVRSQLETLLPADFASVAGADRLPDLIRYLQAMVVRVTRLADNPLRDRQELQRVFAVQDQYDELLDELPAQLHGNPDVAAIHWLLEEFRISVFAPGQRTATPVSEKRISKAIDAARARALSR